MAYQSKTQQREELSTDYDAGKATLNSKDVTMKSSGDNGPKKLYGSLMEKDNSMRLYGKVGTQKMSSGVAGPMRGDGYPDGPKWKRANTDSTRTSAGTVRMTTRSGEKEFVMKTTGSMPKALRGGK